MEYYSLNHKSHSTYQTVNNGRTLHRFLSNNKTNSMPLTPQELILHTGVVNHQMAMNQEKLRLHKEKDS